MASLNAIARLTASSNTASVLFVWTPREAPSAVTQQYLSNSVHKEASAESLPVARAWSGDCQLDVDAAHLARKRVISDLEAACVQVLHPQNRHLHQAAPAEGTCFDNSQQAS
jgi:hypothetical protein